MFNFSLVDQQFFKTGLFIKIVTYWEVLVSVLVVCPCKICVPASLGSKVYPLKITIPYQVNVNLE